MIIILVILIIIWLLDDGTKKIYKNGRKFRVIRDRKSEESLLYLEDVMNELEKFVLYLTVNKIFSDSKTRLLNYKIKNMILGERAKNETEVGYTVNKGREIRVCLRDFNGNLIDKDVVLFIILHELAHIITESYGHTNEFWGNYKQLEESAKTYGLVKNFDPTISCPM